MNKGQQHLYAAGLILLHLVLTVAYSVIVPLGEAPDETDHWAYVVYLAEKRQLPVGPKPTQGKHPPLYHIGAALAALPAHPTFTFLRSNPDIQIPPTADIPNFFIHTTQESWPWQAGALAFHLARFWSVLLNTGTVLAAYGLMQSAFPTQRVWGLATTGLLAFVPAFSFMGGVINNDNAAAFWGTLALWGAVAVYQNQGRLTAGWWLPLALGCGLLSKVSTLALWPVAAIALALGAYTYDKGKLWVKLPLRRTLLTGFVTFGVAIALAAPWLLRNWQLYGDPLGMALTRQTIDLRLEPWTGADSLWLLRGWFFTFWGKFGVIGHLALPDWIYQSLAGLALVSAAGLIKLWVRPPTPQTRPLLGLFLLAAVSTMGVIWQYSLIALGTDQGRLLYPAIVPLLALFTGGLLAWTPPRFHWSLTHLLIGSFLVLALYALGAVVRPAFAPPAPVAPVELADLAPVEPIVFGDLTLSTWRLAENPTLYWSADQPIAADLRVVLRIVAADGTLVWEWRRAPGGGRWSTDHWPPDVILRDAYTIRWPEWAPAGRYLVEVGVEPFNADFLLPQQNDQPATETGQPFAFLGWLEYLP